MNARNMCRVAALPRSRSAPAIRGWVLAGWAAAIAGLTALPGRAAAEPAGSPAPGSVLTAHGLPGRRIAVITPVERITPSAAVSPVLYLNRCTGGCTVTRGDNNDARNHVSSIPSGAPTGPGSSYAIAEFAIGSVAGAGADADWAQVVKCMKEVYAPYNITVTDVQPPIGTGYNEAIIAGSPDQIGQPMMVLGVAPLASDCSAIDNVISFSFANEHSGTGMDLVYNICWTASQESAHAYGLDHEFTFTTGNAANDHSACNDPMTYRTDCGGEKFFRNETANCGETANRACRCGATQNSHAKVLSVFGASPAPTIVAAPTAQLLELNSGDLLGTAVAVAAGAQRGVTRIDLYFNGFKWAETTGAPFGMRGQPNPSNYAIPVPNALPNSIVDVKAIAYDDLGASTESATVTVTKGAACTTATSCAKGQKCEAGKCFWDPPAGEIGASCSYPQFCKSGICTGTAEQQICTQSCVPGSADSCPSGFECLMSGPGTGVCFFSSSGGCCSVDRGGGAWWLPVSLGLAVLGLVARPRRRRRRR